MITQIANFHLFYPMLFTTIGVISLALIFAIKAILIKFKDTDSKNFLFKTHVEEHTDTTSKMKDMHTEVIQVLPPQYEKELHSIHTDIKKTNDRFEALANDITEKLDKILLRVIELEKERQQQQNNV